MLPVLAIASVRGSTDRFAVLAVEAFADEQERVLLRPRDPQVWYAEALRIRLRHGHLGYAVVVDHEVVISKDRRLLPEGRW